MMRFSGWNFFSLFTSMFYVTQLHLIMKVINVINHQQITELKSKASFIVDNTLLYHPQSYGVFITYVWLKGLFFVLIRKTIPDLSHWFFVSYLKKSNVLPISYSSWLVLVLLPNISTIIK